MNQSGVHPNSRAAVSQSNRERAAAARRERELRARTPHPTPHLDAARDEFGSTRPTLAVESLEERLARCLPGATATLERNGWWIRRGSKVLLAGAVSQREAVNLAVTLWGSR